MLPVVIAAADRVVIAREERHLAWRYGTDYDEYCRLTRRWL
jgi:protein-S-isoprenylcysteine O-methyltransferase Ste14